MVIHFFCLFQVLEEKLKLCEDELKHLRGSDIREKELRAVLNLKEIDLDKAREQLDAKTAS